MYVCQRRMAADSDAGPASSRSAHTRWFLAVIFNLLAARDATGNANRASPSRASVNEMRRRHAIQKAYYCNAAMHRSMEYCIFRACHNLVYFMRNMSSFCHDSKLFLIDSSSWDYRVATILRLCFRYEETPVLMHRAGLCTAAMSTGHFSCGRGP